MTITKPLRTDVLAETLERWILRAPSSDVGSVESFSFATAGLLDDEALNRLRSLEDPENPGFVAELYGATWMGSTTISRASEPLSRTEM